MLSNDEILIAAKKPMIGHFLSLFVEHEHLGHPFEVIADGMRALNLAVEVRPSVMLLDLFMPNLGGLNILSRLEQLHKRIPVLCYCNLLNKRYGVIAMKAGAWGVIDFTASHDEFVQAIKVIQHGGTFVPDAIQTLLNDRDYEIYPEKYRGLTSRQAECLELIGYGLSHEEIGQRMGVCKQMVSRYKKQIADKLGLSSAQEIAIYAIRNGFVEIEEDGGCLLNPLTRRPKGSGDQLD